MTATLAREAVQQYEMDGYLSPLQILSSDEVARYRGEVEALYAELARTGSTRLPTQTHLHFRWAYDLVTHPRILDAVEAIVGPNILVHATTIFARESFIAGSASSCNARNPRKKNLRPYIAEIASRHTLSSI